MRGLIFDCDGVLADTEAIVCRATIAMFREMYGVEMAPEEFTPYIGTGPIRYTEGPAENRGIEIDLDAAVARRQELFIEFINSGDSIGFPGANAIIESAIASPGWKLGIATSSSREKSRNSLGAAGVPIDEFDAYITGDDVPAKKPAPDIYLRAAEALEIDPAVCIGIEDSVNGVTSVKGAGMICIAVTNSFDAEDLAEADRIIDSLEELDLDQLNDMLSARHA